ncbi:MULTISPECIES: hypothetical protein [Halomonas]|jgi:hypothetical protein|uniref:Uncharacterized protein n=1 Tax=Halomonas mongoliensis TaxID=321265 RepID=A0ABU1GQ61_9GAMM|nr:MULTISPECIES: hypothetical protein [Halomonas]MDR5894114.1 hypothetical protein [Halomonas mongoliensis]
MIWHLIAAIFAGLGAAGIGLLLRLASGKRLPTWIIPVFAGLGMLGYQVHYEYSWLTHKQAQLPATASVVEVEHASMFWRPWTYAFPMANAFSAVDSDSMRARETADGERLVEYIRYRFEKQHVDLVTHQAWLMNCESRETLPLVGEERRPRLEAMRELDAEDPVYLAVCRG